MTNVNSKLLVIIPFLIFLVLLFKTNDSSPSNLDSSSSSSPSSFIDDDHDQHHPISSSSSLLENNVNKKNAKTQVSFENGKCSKVYSSFRCVDNDNAELGTSSLVGGENIYGFNIYNRSCLYENVVFENYKFHLYLSEKDIQRIRKSSKSHQSKGNNNNNDEQIDPELIVPPVTLSSRPFDLPNQHRKRSIVKNKMRESHSWRPSVRVGPIPCNYLQKSVVAGSENGDENNNNNNNNNSPLNTVLAYYSPIVAPWNYAHTLLCDLFGVFWAAYDLFGQDESLVPKNMQIVAFGKHYASDFHLPNKNKAFHMMSTKPPCYEGGLKNGVVYGKLIAGMGTKSWSWVTSEYKANGSPTVWYDFRRHILKTVGLLKEGGGRKEDIINHDEQHVDQEGAENSKKQQKKNTIHVSICHKKDKRGVVNYEETLQVLQEAAKEGYFSSDGSSNLEVNFALESSVGKKADAQVQLMLDADIYICNEGTLSTPLFLMRPGKSYVSLPLVYHTPHLHQRNMPKPNLWWRMPDPLRPDPRKNVGGNIDWFPQAIPWVKTFWYDYIPLNETRIQLPLSGLRNYMPDMNIVIQKNRILPLVKQAVDFVKQARKKNNNNYKNIDAVPFSQIPVELLTDRPNYSITANLCRQMLQASPNMTNSFNTARCQFGMSWLCEFWANTQFKWRFLHGKWSYHFCGGKASSVEFLKLKDPRVTDRPLKEFLFFTKDELLGMYNDTDFGKLREKPGEEETRFFDESSL